MTGTAFDPAELVERLLRFPAPSRYVILASGGLDSTVLLHALARERKRLPAALSALHFDHGIAPESDRWRRVVETRAATLGVEFVALNLALGPGGAVETRAREARYAALAQWMKPDDCCVAAHHADDQAETFLLQALRGSGPIGLAGMPDFTRFGPGWLARPLLAWTRSDLAAWAGREGIGWIEDPGNRDLAAPRNWLRHRVFPILEPRWRSAARTLSRSAKQSADAARLLEEFGHEDLARLSVPDRDRLPVRELLALSSARRRNLLRIWLRKRGIPLPSDALLGRIERDFVMRDPGARASVEWPGAEAHRFRDMLHVIRPLPSPMPGSIPLVPGKRIDLGPLGRIGFVADAGGGLDPKAVAGTLELRFRTGGERLRPAGSSHRRPLKKLLQEAGVLPWMRYRLPLLFVDGRLAAVPGVAVAAEYAGRGWGFRWEDGPPLR